MSNLGGTIKSIRDIFRKDPGLSGDAQRIEQLGWMIFLKLFDDKDKEREILDPIYKSAIPARLQWRNWAENDEGITGDELINFVNNKLFPQLKDLPVTADNRLGVIIRNIFDGTNNYMKSGTTFRQAINKLNEIDFNSSKEHHIFNAIYEDILQGLATKKDTGEFYTPRAVTQFIVDMVNPQLGEKLKDPANGTGGFLVCAIEHLRKQVKNVADLKILQETISGAELKPLPFMLSVINLIIHDIEVPQIENGDSLSREYTSYKQADRVDIIVTNPPFGGVVGDGMETNFPLNYRTKESADLFLILFIQLLKDGGRAGIVLPDGSLTGEGVKARVREKLLTDCNVHTIVRLPQSVFAPYATVNTNLIFFEKSGGTPNPSSPLSPLTATREIWYYEHTLPEGAKAYNKTKPIRIEEFEPLKTWWNNRAESEVAWKVSIATIRERGFDLDIKNPTIKSKVILDIDEASFRQNETEKNLFNALNEFSSGLSVLNCRNEIENLFKFIDKIINVPKVIPQIESYLLDIAIKGKLVMQDKNDEPASELLKRIKAGKAKSVKKEKPLPPIKADEIPFEIPENWVWCRLGEIVQISSGDGLTSFQMSKIGRIPVYGGNGINGYHDKANIEKETIVIGRVGYYCGCIHLTASKAWVTDNAFVVSYSETNFDREFLIQLLKWADLGKQQYAGSQPVISGMRVYPKLIPIPPLTEQKRIVAEIERQLAKTKKLKEHIIANQHATEQLLKALLHGAFQPQLAGEVEVG